MPTFSTTIPIRIGSIYAGQNPVYTNFIDAHNAPDGVVAQPTQGTPSSVVNVGVQAFVGRATTQYRIARVFGYIDLSAYAPNITSIDFIIPGLNTTGGVQDVIICQADAFVGGTSNTLQPTDFDVNSAWNINVPYTATTIFQNNTFSMSGNVACVGSANGNSSLNFVLLNSSYDYSISPPPVGRTGFNLYSTLDLTANQFGVDGIYTQPGYPNDVNGVVSGNVGEVNGILSSNIQVIIGV